MKFKLFIIAFICLFSLSAMSCSTVRVKNKHAKAKSIPPGQAKKIVGTKSAKPFAPGQNK